MYKGRTREGEVVAVKVQRPGVLASVALDIYILRGLVRSLRYALSIVNVFSFLISILDEASFVECANSTGVL